MEISAEESAKRARNANFSQAEVAVLLEEVALEKETINCSFNSHMTLQKKDRVWRAIQMRVNACGVANRSIKQLKAKLGTMKMDVRAKKRHGRGTGGGKPLPKPDFEEVVAEIIGKDSATFNGLEVDGTETFLKRHRLDSVSSTNGAPARHPSQSQALLMERPSTSLDGGPTMHSTPRREENRGVLHRVASAAILPITLDFAEPRIIEVEVHHETVPEAEGSSFGEWQPLDSSSSSRANPSTPGLHYRSSVENPQAQAQLPIVPGPALEEPCAAVVESQYRRAGGHLQRRKTHKSLRSRVSRVTNAQSDAESEVFNQYLRSSIAANSGNLELMDLKKRKLQSSIAIDNANLEIINLQKRKLQLEIAHLTNNDDA